MTENPKHYAGQKKIPFGDVPAIVMAELGIAMHEGARKYGAYNYRKDAIIASDYYDAAKRHLTQWYELGEDWDADCGISHITKAIAALVVLRDAQINGMCKDDRPPLVNRKHWAELEAKVKELRERHPEPAKRVTSWDSGVKPPANPSWFFNGLGTAHKAPKLADVEAGQYFEPPVAGYGR